MTYRALIPSRPGTAPVIEVYMSESDQPPSFAVLGATGGIGSALTRRLIGSGARVAIASRDQGRLDALAAETGAVAQSVDATDFRAVEQWIAGVGEKFGRLDGAVNCVGSMLLKPAHLTTQAEFDETVAKNLTTAFALVRACAKTLRRSGGSIVLMSSCAARTGLPNHEAIAAVKAAIEALARSGSASYAAAGIRVNAVAPGLVRTPMTERITGNEKALENSRAMHPLGRIGTPEEIAAAITYLLSEDATWITGQTLGVDGGLSTVRPR